MGVEILSGDHGAAFVCTTEEQAFGPMFDSGREAKAFLDSLDDDPRTLQNEGDLDGRYKDWKYDEWRPGQ